MMYWTYATRSLARGGQRSLLAIFCVAVGVLAIVALQLVGNSVATGLTGDARALNGGDVAASSTTALLTAAQLAYFDHLQAQGTITGYTAIDTIYGQIHQGAVSFMAQTYVVNPAQFPLAGAPVFTNPAHGSLGSVVHGDQAVITTTLAQTLHAQVGDTVQLNAQDGRTVTATVGGIIQSAGYFHGQLIILDQAFYGAAASITNQALTYNTVYMNVPDHTDDYAARAAQAVQAHFPLASLTTTKQLLANNQAQVQDVEYFLQIVALLALLIGGVGIVNTMQVLLRRRRVEIAMLKTMGYRRRDLYAFFGLETGLIGLIGGIVGAAAGVGVSVFVRGLMERSLQIALPTTIDPLTVGAGVVVGCVTALIFGILPIAQASQVRPLAVLRELPEGQGWQNRLLAFGLLITLVVLFFGLALSILRNAGVAIGVVAITGAVLGLLGIILGGAVWVISALPVLDRMTWWFGLLSSAALLVAILLTVALPAFGWLVLAVVVLGLIAQTLPRSAKANVRLALRNIGRQRARSVTTMLALYIGVFAIGLILVFGQNIQQSISSFVASGPGINAEIVASNTQGASVRSHLTGAKGLAHLSEMTLAVATPVAVNGQPIGDFVQSVTADGKHSVTDATSFLTGAQGYDLAHGAAPDPADVALASGRQLANATEALLPDQASQAPDNLKVGDTITIASATGSGATQLTIVGFYTSLLPQLHPILTDSSVVATLTNGQPQYGFRLHLDPNTVDQTLADLQAAAPGITTLSVNDFVGQFTQQLQSLIQVLEAVASLAVLASVIIIANAVALAMLERRREVGILKAVGQTSRGVLNEVLLENGIVGFTGALLAMILVVGLAAILGATLFHLPMQAPMAIVLGVVAATAAVCMLVASLVAWGATRVRPVAVLRYE